MIDVKSPRKLAKAMAAFEETTAGSFYMPYYTDAAYQTLGLTPEKLIIPKNYHNIIQMCYDFYQRGGSVGKVIDRLVELSITEIRNGQRKTTDLQNEYFRVLLHDKPSRLMRFLHMAAREYFLSGMVLPRIDWTEIKGRELSPNLPATKNFIVPSFDLYPATLVHVKWVGWGKKAFYLKIEDTDMKAIKNKGGKIKEQQLRYKMWVDQFPALVRSIQEGATDKVLITDSDPILRNELSIDPYPTPYLFNVLEALVFKQQLRRMDYAVASRIINAILLVQEGNDEYPLTEETNDNLANLQAQIMARQNDPRKQERLFMLFTNHTTKLTWITPDVEALLDQDKYREVNEEIDEGLGFPGVLLTGSVRQGAQASEISTWAIQPQMEFLRMMFIEWIKSEVFWKGSELNGFRNIPEPSFKPIKLQDMVKTAAVFQQLYTEGNVSRTTRDEMAGLDFETEAELMKDEAEIAKDLPAFTPTPYSPLPPMIGSPTQGNGKSLGAPKGGRPTGSQNTPVNNRNSGVKPKGQQPTSKVKAEAFVEMSDEDVIDLIDTVAKERNLTITIDDLLEK